MPRACSPVAFTFGRGAVFLYVRAAPREQDGHRIAINELPPGVSLKDAGQGPIDRKERNFESVTLQDFRRLPSGRFQDFVIREQRRTVKIAPAIEKDPLAWVQPEDQIIAPLVGSEDPWLAAFGGQ